MIEGKRRGNVRYDDFGMRDVGGVARYKETIRGNMHYWTS